MKRIVVALLALALLPGCSLLPASANQPPTAYIDSITPAEATPGQTVRLTGHGTDADGQVVGYRWRSDRDGDLGRTATVETTSLSAGNHIIYFSVQDNNDNWSQEVSGSVRVVAASAPPTITRFDGSMMTIKAGDSVTLSWKVLNATSVVIDQGIGSVALEGSTSVKPAQTITYTLTATGANATVSARLTIMVESGDRTVTLTPDIEMTGFVRSLGIYTPGSVYVGDDSGDRGIQGFITYDISCVPEDATITQVSIDMSDYEAPYGSPLPDLGCLTAYVHNYSTLYGQYRLPDDLPTPIGEWCSLGDLDSGWDSSKLLNAVQARVGKTRFQFRLQFADGETDGNSDNDLFYWSESNLPTLTIEYYT